MKAVRTERGCVAEHIACARCGYDRFGSPAHTACPECDGQGYTRHFRGRRRVRRLAVMVFALATLQLGLGLGVRGCFAYHGVSVHDFATVGATQPSSPQGLRAAPFLDLMIHSTNALCCGAPVSMLLTLVIVLFGLRFGETRGVMLALLALLILIAAMRLGSQQSAALGLN